MAENNRFEIGMLKNYVNDNKTNYCYVLEVTSDARHLCNLLNQLNNKNEQLKSRVEYLERKIDRERISYQKQHEKWEEEIQKENEYIKNTIQEAYNSERTQIGKSVLKQLMENVL